LGLGTSSPASNLHLSATGEARLIVEGDSNNDSGEESALIEFKTDGGAVRHRAEAAGSTGNDLKLIAGSADTSSSVNSNIIFETKAASASATEAMRISSAGIVTKPLQPAFHADADGTASLAVNNTVVFNNARINVGNHYSTTTGKFTAPVDGKYLIYWSGIGGTAADVYRYYLRINDSDYLDGVQVRLDSRASAYDYGSKQEILSLSANDTVKIYFTSASNNATYADDNFLTFGGFLLG
jgi:hypothetical protein